MGVPPMPWGSLGRFPVANGWNHRGWRGAGNTLSSFGVSAQTWGKGKGKPGRGGHRQPSPHGRGVTPGPGCSCHQASTDSALRQPGVGAAAVQPTCDTLPYFLSLQGSPSHGVSPAGYPWDHQVPSSAKGNIVMLVFLISVCVCVRTCEPQPSIASGSPGARESLLQPL